MSVDLERFAEGIHEHIRRMLEPYRERIKELEGRLQALEQGTLADAYRGTYDEAVTYHRGELITHAGSLWLCLHETGDRPGRSANWKMIVKGGQS
jgi:phosphoenolpyruvate carboxylase